MNSDNQLMLNVKAGDLDKLGILFERHKNALFGYFYRILFDKNVSEDMVQNVFFRMLKYRSKFTGYGKFSSWMYHIAHNVYLDHFKKKSNHFQIDQIPDECIEEYSQTDAIILQNESHQLLNKAFKMLNSEQREILTLSKYQNLKYKEIGLILGCSEGAVKVRIFRALYTLKEKYTQLEE